MTIVTIINTKKSLKIYAKLHKLYNKKTLKIYAKLHKIYK